MTDTDAVRGLLTLWYETRAWAEHLLCERLALNSAKQVLDKPYRGTHTIPGTVWTYRTHGVGVEVTRPGYVGGIDFDFEAAEPDAWRLRDFLVKQYRAGVVRKRDFRPLLEDLGRWNDAVAEVLHSVPPGSDSVPDR
jgi:hypothetical protein